MNSLVNLLYSKIIIEYQLMNHYQLIFLLVSLLYLSQAQTINNTVFTPKEFAKNDLVIQDTTHPGEYRYSFTNIDFEVDGKVYQFQGDSLTSTNNFINYEANSSQYIISQDCSIQPSQIVLQKISQINASKGEIKSYHFTNDAIFVLSEDSISYFTLENDQPSSHLSLQMTGTLSNIQASFNLTTSNSKFITLRKRTYLLDSQNMFLISVVEQGPSDVLNLTQVEGYQKLSQFGELIKVIVKEKQSIVVLSNEGITQYTFNQNSTTKCTSKALINETKQLKHNFVDIAVTNNYLILLEEVEGIFLHTTFTTQGDFVKFLLKFEGKFVKMEVIGKTIEVIGQYQGKRYVVQLFLQLNLQLQGQIVVNRFYNQITGIRDVDFFDNKAIFIGDDEIMIIGHSVNRNLLLNLDKRQNRQIYLSYGILQFDVVQSVSTSRKAYIIGITKHQLIMIYFNQTSPELVCQVNGTTGMYRLMVQFNTTSCQAFNWKNWKTSATGSQSFCRVRESVNLEVITPVSSRMGKVLMIAAAVICLIGILVLTGFACKFRRIKFRLFQRMIDEIEKRRNAAVSVQRI